MSVQRQIIWFLKLALCLAVIPSGNGAAWGQEARPFTKEAEVTLRQITTRFEKQRGQNPQNQDPYGSLFKDQVSGGDLNPTDQDTTSNRLEQTSQNSEFSDDPFARFEARGGDPYELKEKLLTPEGLGLTSEESRLTKTREGKRALNRPDGKKNEEQNGDNSESGEDDSQDTLAAENDSFEERFLKAEREMAEGGEPGETGQDQSTAGLNNQQSAENQRRGLPARLQNARLAADNLQSQQEVTTREEEQRRLRRQLANEREAIVFNEQEPDVNDITGSIRPNAVEDIYAWQGRKISSFRLFSELTINGIISDNPTASVTNGPGDEALELIPHLRLESTWSRHALTLEGQLHKSYFDEFTSENIDEWYIAATGRVDITRNDWLEIEGRLAEEQDDRGDIDNLNTDTELAKFRTSAITATYNHDWNRLSLRLSGSLIDYDYDDTTNSLAIVQNNDDLDYLEQSATGRLSYTFNPHLYTFLEGQYVRRDYDAHFDDLGFARSNEGETVSIGIISDITALLRFEGTIGHEWLEADDARFAQIKEVVYSAALTYRHSEKTTFVIRTERDIEHTDIDGAVGFIETDYSLSLSHYFRPHLRLGAEIRYEEEDYPGLTTEQDTFSTALSLQYILSSQLRLLASYQYTDNISNGGGDYQENIFRLGVNVRP